MDSSQILPQGSSLPSLTVIWEELHTWKVTNQGIMDSLSYSQLEMYFDVKTQWCQHAADCLAIIIQVRKHHKFARAAMTFICGAN